MTDRSPFMKCLAITDVHGNIRALDAVLQAAGEVDLVISVGDEVGFCLQPNEVIDRLRSLPNLVPVKGNWANIAQEPLPAGTDTIFDKLLHSSLGSLTHDAKEYLRYLPDRGYLRLGGVSVAIVHEVLLDPAQAGPTPGPATTVQEIPDASCVQLVIHGDSHLQEQTEKNGMTFVNPGSVGWPSDGDWRPGYAIIEFEAGGFQVQFGRVEYDVDAVYREIEAAGIPNPRNILVGKSWDIP